MNTPVKKGMKNLTPAEIITTAIAMMEQMMMGALFTLRSDFGTNSSLILPDSLRARSLSYPFILILEDVIRNTPKATNTNIIAAPMFELT